MRYASVLFTIFIVWIVVIGLAAMADDTTMRVSLYYLVTGFTTVMFLFGFTLKR